MLLLSCENLSRGFDQGPLFENLGLELFAGQRAGLVGPNGVGKSTLMKILGGVDKPDTGDVRLHAGARISLLQQTAQFVRGRPLFEEAKSGLKDLIAAHEDMLHTAELLAQAQDETQRKSLAMRYDRLHEMLRFHDAYQLDHRIEEILEGLGFVKSDYDRAVETFSGGQQSRLMLAKLLLSAPDVMLLDEPSNHLDIPATRWLEDYLARQPEAMLIVSHDRYFLDKVVTKIFEMHNERISSYPGNYQAYQRLRGERYEQQLKAYQAQKELIEKKEEYIRKNHYGQLARQSQSRQKQLDKIEVLERPTQIETPYMHFGEVRRSGDIVLQVDELSKAYDRPLFQNLSFQLKRGQRLGIMGPNGSGKTTLLRCLLKQEEPDSGRIQHGALVEFGYYDQHLRCLEDDKTVMRAVWPYDDNQATEQQMRDLLGRFGMVGDIVHQQVGKLSGGERSRAALARLVAAGVNVLVLDEPTNHLDLWACDALEQALLDFQGTAIVVSHDRYFLNRVVDVLLALEGDGTVHVIYGNYETYVRMMAIRADEEKAKKTKEVKAPPPLSAEEEARKAKRKRKFPFRKVEDLEADIAATETQVQELERSLASPEIYKEKAKVTETARVFEEAKVRLAQLYEHWEEAVELNAKNW